MDTTEAVHEQAEDVQQEYANADLLSRVIARAIDIIIVLALYEIIPGVGYLAGLTYLVIADGLFRGRSAGKRLAGLKVIVRHSSRAAGVCGFRESVIRNIPFAAAYILYGLLGAVPYIGWLVSSLIVIAVFLFDGLVILGSEEGMRLGDELAKTRVVQDRQGGLNVQ